MSHESKDTKDYKSKQSLLSNSKYHKKKSMSGVYAPTLKQLHAPNQEWLL